MTGAARTEVAVCSAVGPGKGPVNILELVADIADYTGHSAPILALDGKAAAPPVFQFPKTTEPKASLA